MKKLKNGWLHKKSFTKAIMWSSLVIIGFIGFTCYQIFGREASALTGILYAVLGFLIASMVFTTFYSKDLREFSNEVNNVYMSMDPKSFYDYIESLDLSILCDETLTKIAFFMAWFKHFEGKNEEALELFNAKAKDPFPYPRMISLKCLIEIYLLEDKTKGYEVIHKNVDQLHAATNLKPKERQQLEAEIQGQIGRVDAIVNCDANDEVIASLKQQMVPFEYVQNQLFLAYLLKDKDPKTAYFAKDYVLNNYGQFFELKNVAEKLEINFVPTEEDLREHEEELHPELNAPVEETLPLENNEEPTSDVVDSNVIDNEENKEQE